MANDVDERMLDKVVKRNRALRNLVGVVIISIEAGLFLAVGLFLASLLGWPFGGLAIAASLYLGGRTVALTVPYITAIVKYPWGLVTQDMITGNPVVYGAGLHFKLPWETVEEKSNISLEDRTTIEQNLTIATKSDELKVKISFQWRADLKNLATFFRLEDSTKAALFEPIERFVSTSFADMTAEEARQSQSILSRLLLAAFKGTVEEAISKIPPNHDKWDVFVKEERLFAEDVQNYEKQYGIHVVQVNVSDVDFSDEVKKARAGLAEHRSIEELYYSIAGGKDAYSALSLNERAKIRAEARVITGNATEKQINMTGSSGGVFVNADER